MSQSEQKPPTSSSRENFMLGVWGLCGVVFLIGVLGRRFYLLETIVPLLAFIGFILLGVSLLKTYKEKEKKEKEKKQLEETEQLLSQIEKLNQLNQKK